MEDSSLFSGPFQSEGSRMTGGTHLIPGLAQGTDKRFLIGFGGKIVSGKGSASIFGGGWGGRVGGWNKSE
jgi:hypothetical protein